MYAVSLHLLFFFLLPSFDKQQRRAAWLKTWHSSSQVKQPLIALPLKVKILIGESLNKALQNRTEQRASVIENKYPY